MITEIKQALAEFRDGLQKALGDNLIEVRLFGSRARGDAEPDSDVDVCVLVKRRSKRLKVKVMDVAVELSLKHDLLIMPLIMTPARLADEEDMETLLYHDLMTQGIVI